MRIRYETSFFFPGFHFLLQNTEKIVYVLRNAIHHVGKEGNANNHKGKCKELAQLGFGHVSAVANRCRLKPFDMVFFF